MSSWAKMSSNLDHHPKIRMAGREGREVFLFVLRRNAELDLGGIVPRLHLEPWYLAAELMMSEQEAMSGLSRAVTAGLLRDDGAMFVISGWDDEWGKRPLTEAERKARQRAKSKPSTNESGHVTEASGHESDCPESHALEERRIDKKRVEEIMVPPSAAKPQDPPLETLKRKVERGLRLPRKHPLPSDWEPRGDERDLAATLDVGCDSAAERFRNHHIANGTRFADWHRAFRNWLYKANEFGQGRRSQTGMDAVLSIARGETK